MQRPDGGTHFPLSSRRAESLMAFPITDRRATVPAYPSLRPAGADEAEADTAQAVAADPSVIDAERHAAYRDGVEHVTTLDGLSGGHKSCSTSPTPPAESASDTRNYAKALRRREAESTERIRRARLSRWQEQR